MIKKYCDICNKEIKDYDYETYSVTIERNEDTYENSRYYKDVCKDCVEDLYAYIVKMKSGD